MSFRIFVCAVFPISESKLKLDSIAINPEESLKIQKVFSAKRVEVECAYGNVVFEGDLNLLVQDNRIFGGTTYSLRFMPRKEGNTLTWNIKVSFEEPDGSPIYMNNYENHGFCLISCIRLSIINMCDFVC